MESEKESELLDAASARWPSAQSYAAPSPHHLMDRQKHTEGGAAMANVMLPLLLDNTSWRAYVQYPARTGGIARSWQGIEARVG